MTEETKMLKNTAIPRNFPKEFESGSISTFNGKGFMFTDLSPAAKEFVKLAKTAKNL